MEPVVLAARALRDSETWAAFISPSAPSIESQFLKSVCPICMRACGPGHLAGRCHRVALLCRLEALDFDVDRLRAESEMPSPGVGLANVLTGEITVYAVGTGGRDAPSLWVDLLCMLCRSGLASAAATPCGHMCCWPCARQSPDFCSFCGESVSSRCQLRLPRWRLPCPAARRSSCGAGSGSGS